MEWHTCSNVVMEFISLKLEAQNIGIQLHSITTSLRLYRGPLYVLQADPLCFSVHRMIINCSEIFRYNE